MTRRGLTNSLVYQSRLMLDLAKKSNLGAEADACEKASLVLMHRALSAAVCEAAESYGVALSADASIHSSLEHWQEIRPDAWELKDVRAGLKEPNHWMRLLDGEVTAWSSQWTLGQVKKSDPNRIALVQDDSQKNRYSLMLDELQQWIDEMRVQNDYS